MTEHKFSPIHSDLIGGAITVNVFALLSTIALLSVILRIAWLAFQRCLKSADVRECVFLNTQLGQYAACLIIAMVFNAISGILGVRWTLHGGITEGWICRFQAALMQIGNFATAYFTTAIAVHTFNSLVLRMKQSVIICRTTIGMGWVFAFLIAFIPFTLHMSEGHVYGANGLSCGIRQIFPKIQFFFHILPILLASFFGAILYSLIFLVLRGTLNIKQGIRITLNPQDRWNDVDGLGENYHRFIARVAKSMLWYPVAYVALLIPYAVTRLFMISGFHVPPSAPIFSAVCYISLSFVDVLLLYNTFRLIGPAFDARSTMASKRTESFGSSGTLEKYGSLAPSLAQQSEMEKKIQQYRSQNSGSPLSISSGRSAQHLLPLYLGQAGADKRSSRQSNPPLIGRSITPASSYSQWEVATSTPVPVVAQSPGSLPSLGLPAPPRRTRSSVSSQPVPELQLPDQLNDNAYTDRGMPRQLSTQTFGYPDSPSINSPDFLPERPGSGSGWSSRIHHHNVSPEYHGQPRLSAVSPSFPRQVYSTSPH